MYKRILSALVMSIIMTGLTWFYSSPLIGSMNRGFPFAYHLTPVVQNPVPTWNYVNLIIDIVIWWVVAFVIIYAIKFKKKVKAKE